jgi:hypothetical protein
MHVNARLREISQPPWQTQTDIPGKEHEVSFLSIFQIIEQNFLFPLPLFRMAPSKMFWTITS